VTQMEWHDGGDIGSSPRLSESYKEKGFWCSEGEEDGELLVYYREGELGLRMRVIEFVGM